MELLCESVVVLGDVKFSSKIPSILGVNPVLIWNEVKFRFKFEFAFGVLGEAIFLGDGFIVLEANGEDAVSAACKPVVDFNGTWLYFLLTVLLLFLIFFNKDNIRVFSTRSEEIGFFFDTCFSVFDVSVGRIFIGPRIAALPFWPMDNENLPKLEEWP